MVGFCVYVKSSSCNVDPCWEFISLHLFMSSSSEPRMGFPSPLNKTVVCRWIRAGRGSRGSVCVTSQRQSIAFRHGQAEFKQPLFFFSLVNKPDVRRALECSDSYETGDDSLIKSPILNDKTSRRTMIPQHVVVQPNTRLTHLPQTIVSIMIKLQ